MVENILMIRAMLLLTIGSVTQSIESLVLLRRLKYWRVQDWQLCMDLIQIVQVFSKIISSTVFFTRKMCNCWRL